MSISFEYSFKPTNTEKIREFELKYNIVSPEDYKKFLLENNGGKPNIRRFQTADGIHTSSLMLLFPLSAEKEPNLVNIYKEFNMEGLIHSDFLAIGADPMENKICICIKGNNIGSIYYWSLDMEEFNEDEYVPSYKYMSLVAKNFNDFINGLFVPED